MSSLKIEVSGNDVEAIASSEHLGVEAPSQPHEEFLSQSSSPKPDVFVDARESPPPSQPPSAAGGLNFGGTKPQTPKPIQPGSEAPLEPQPRTPSPVREPATAEGRSSSRASGIDQFKAPSEPRIPPAVTQKGVGSSRASSIEQFKVPSETRIPPAVSSSKASGIKQFNAPSQTRTPPAVPQMRDDEDQSAVEVASPIEEPHSGDYLLPRGVRRQEPEGIELETLPRGSAPADEPGMAAESGASRGDRVRLVTRAVSEISNVLSEAASLTGISKLGKTGEVLFAVAGGMQAATGATKIKELVQSGSADKKKLVAPAVEVARGAGNVVSGVAGFLGHDKVSALAWAVSEGMNAGTNAPKLYQTLKEGEALDSDQLATAGDVTGSTLKSIGAALSPTVQGHVPAFIQVAGSAVSIASGVLKPDNRKIAAELYQEQRPPRQSESEPAPGSYNPEAARTA